jgi:hypothetical protein
MITPYKQIHDRSLSWLGTDTLQIISGGFRLVLCATPPLVMKWCSHCMCFPHVSKIAIVTYNGANSFKYTERYNFEHYT